MKKGLLTLALALVPMLGLSQHRSERDAISIAQDFWGNKVNRAKLKVVSLSSVTRAKARAMSTAASTTSGTKQSFYVINDEERSRFVIVSSDERLNKILGYSDNGVFDAETAPVGLIDMMNNYDEQFTNVYSELDKVSKGVQKNNTFPSVQPLIETKWGQGDPYNAYCPKDITSESGENCVTGCVATAMAQVMCYWKYPESGTGSNTYTSSTQHINQSMDFSTVHFDWANMLNEYNGDATETNKAAVASLMHAAGVSVSMDYAKSSGAYAVDMAYALSNFWKYNPNVSYKRKQYYSDEAWNKLIIGELKAGHPILYAGRDKSGGHQFVLDGCNEDGMYHFNFGWNGSCDGYYTLDVLAPAYDLWGTRIPIGYNYTSRQEMVCYVVPQEYGQKSGEFYALSSLGLSSATVGSRKYVSSYIYNYSAISTIRIEGNNSFVGEVGIGLFDKDFQFVKALVKKDVTLSGGSVKSFSGYVVFDAGTFSEGKQYYVALYTHSDMLGYSVVKTEKGAEDFYLATVKDGNISFEALKTMGEATPVAKEVVTGRYNASSTLADGSAVSWQINLWKDEADTTKYWISNIDPIVSKKGYTYEQGWNKAYGHVNENGTVLQVPVNQVLGEDILLRNYAGGNVLSVYLDSDAKSMSMESVWGCEEVDYTSTDATSKELSRYEGGRFTLTTESETADVATPVIRVSESHMLSISCTTEGASIYYTLNGAEPSSTSNAYDAPIEIKGNCTVKALAIKDGQASEVTTYTISDFICATPTIRQTAGSNIVSITTDTQDASIYYTLDNSIPTKNSMHYAGEFSITKSCVIKAIAYKADYKESAIATQSAVYYPSDPDHSDEVVVAGNVAGELSSRVSPVDKANATRWTISGEINGTDIAFIREVFKEGKITDLNLEQAIIVSGGDPYDKVATVEYNTENNVVGVNMFSGAKSLISLVLPSTTRKIKSYAIENCDNLATITIPDSCTEIESSGIYSNKNLSSIHIGRSLEKFLSMNGHMCPALRSITVDTNNNNFVSMDDVLYSKNKDVIYRYPTAKTEISFDLPSSVRVIADYAFSRTSLERITMPDGLETISNGAFDGCKQLLSLDLPQSVKSIGLFTFQNCARITHVVIPDNVTELKSFAFGYCVNLREVNIGASVNKMDGYTFTGCNSLQAFTVSKDNDSYTAEGGILYAKDLTKLVRCPLALYADEMILSDDILVIESNAFQNCKNIKKFILPEGLKEIGSSAFDRCSIEEIFVPGSVEKIGSFAFQNCINLKNFAIPASTNSISSFMLAYCDSLEYLYIPKDVSRIDSYAFSGAKKLNTIECWVENVSELEIEKNYYGEYCAFQDIKEDCTWHVPVGCAWAYKSQPWWVSTWKIHEDLVDGISGVTNESGMEVIPGNRSVDVVASSNKAIDIYDIQGSLIKSVSVNAGQRITIPLRSGVYIINRTKVIIL